MCAYVLARTETATRDSSLSYAPFQGLQRAQFGHLLSQTCFAQTLRLAHYRRQCYDPFDLLARPNRRHCLNAISPRLDRSDCLHGCPSWYVKTWSTANTYHKLYHRRPIVQFQFRRCLHCRSCGNVYKLHWYAFHLLTLCLLTYMYYCTGEQCCAACAAYQFPKLCFNANHNPTTMVCTLLASCGMATISNTENMYFVDSRLPPPASPEQPSPSPRKPVQPSPSPAKPSPSPPRKPSPSPGKPSPSPPRKPSPSPGKPSPSPRKPVKPSASPAKPPPSPRKRVPSPSPKKRSTGRR